MELKDLVNYAGFVIGILALILSIYFYIKGLETKDPRCYFMSARNISKLSREEDSKIRLYYGEKEVSRVFTTYVWVWNNGRKPITKQDIPSGSKTLVHLRDDKYPPKILDYTIVKMSRDKIGFVVAQVDESSLSISFDFLDHYDGAMFEVQHTGSADTELEIEGIILGVPNGVKIINKNPKMLMNLMTGITRHVSTRRLFWITSAFRITTTFCMISLLGLAIYISKVNPTISTTVSQLRKALIAEFPQATEQNISNILARVQTGGGAADTTLSVIFSAVIVLALVPLLLMGSLSSSLTATPYPKSLRSHTVLDEPLTD